MQNAGPNHLPENRKSDLNFIGEGGQAMSDLIRPVPLLPDPKMPVRGNRKLLMGLSIFLIAMGMIVFLNSSLSEIQRIEVNGLDLVKKNEVMELAAVEIGTSYFVPSVPTIEERIATHPTIKNVKVTKSFPGDLKIEVTEYSKVAYLMGVSGVASVLLENGKAVSLPVGNVFIDRPILSGWNSDDVFLGQLIQSLSQIPVQQLALISEIRPFASFAYPDKIKIYTRDGFEIHTTIGYLPKKLPFVPQIIEQVRARSYARGYIDLLEADVFRPFSEDVQKNLLNPTN